VVWDPTKNVLDKGTFDHPWYPTILMLGDKRVLALSGLDEQGNGTNNNTIEINTDPDHAAWQKTRDFDLPLYPHLFQLEDGLLFYTGGKMDTEGDSVPFVFDPINPTGNAVIKNLADIGRGNQCASVIMPPAQDQRIMILGGGPEDPENANAPRGIATKRTQIIDFKEANPAYGPPQNLNHERMHVNAVLLPDQTVIAVGAASRGKRPPRARWWIHKAAEKYSRRRSTILGGGRGL
jgi:hypothetical protein